MRQSTNPLQRTVSLFYWLTLCIAIVLAFPTHVLADPLSAVLGGEATEKPALAADPYGRETPRSLLVSLVAAFASGDADRVTHYLASSSAKPDLAKRLQQRLDSSGSLLPFAALSNESNGDIKDGLSLDQERIGTFRAQSGEVPIVAQRITPKDATPYWVISSDSIKKITREDPVQAKTAFTELFPEVLQKNTIAGAPIADWITLFALTAIFLLSLGLIFSLILKLLRILVNNPKTHRGFQFVVAAFPPLSLYLLMIVLFQTTQQLQVAIVARQIVARYAGIVGWVAFAWFLWRLIDMVYHLWSARMARSDRRRAISALSLVRRSAKVVLVIVAFIAVLDTFGINATTGIAALGLGGLALALGAQKTIENLVGSIAIIIDQPVRVGDFCKVGDVMGTVEDIGMRSTQLRTLERTVVTIPNGNFSSKEIENYSSRDSFLFNPMIALTYDTSAETMRAVLEAIRTLLAEDQNVDDVDARVRFISINKSSLDIEIYAYLITYNYSDSLGMREELLLKIMDAIAQHGAHLALPTQTLMIQPDAMPPK